MLVAALVPVVVGFPLPETPDAVVVAGEFDWVVLLAALLDVSVDIDVVVDVGVKVSAPVAVVSADTTFAPPSFWPFEYELPVSLPLLVE